MERTGKTDETELKRSKYNAKKVLLRPSGEIKELTKEQIKIVKGRDNPKDGTLFDSKDEARYYRDILLPQIQAGKVMVETQPKFTLLPKFEKDGTKHQAVTYTPDFKVTNLQTGITNLVDVKGMQDQKFPIKRKMFDHAFPEFPPLVVMKYCKKFGGWITNEDYARKKRAENKAKKTSS